MIIALGETIVAIGVGASDPGATGVIVAAALGTIAASMLWWLYFDVLALVAEERLTQAPAGPVQNAMARDAYSYIHFLLVAGVVLLALGLKKTLAHVDEPLSTVGAVALCGGAALYIVGLMAFSKRTIRGIASDNYFIVALLIGLAWIGRDLAALEMLLALTIALVASVIFKATRYQNRRREVRRHMVGAGSEERDERTS
jgi:low temperature requirement protein LtrA